MYQNTNFFSIWKILRQSLQGRFQLRTPFPYIRTLKLYKKAFLTICTQKITTLFIFKNTSINFNLLYCSSLCIYQNTFLSILFNLNSTTAHIYTVSFYNIR